MCSTVNVSLLPEGELRTALALLPRLPCDVVNRIIALRPFADKADFLKRVNQEAINARQHVGQKLMARFQFERVELPRTRNVDYAHEQFGLHIEVPYSRGTDGQ